MERSKQLKTSEDALKKKFLQRKPTRMNSLNKLQKFEPSQFNYLGTIIDDYSFKIKIARNKITEKISLIKIMSKTNLIETKQVSHAFNEIINMSENECAGFIDYLGFYQDTKFVYLNMEYSSGGTLFNYLRRIEVMKLDDSL